jgi:nicotinamide mononucleotide transporter
MRPWLEAMQEWAPHMEWTAVGFSLIYVFLAARQNIWCWLFGGLASAISVFLFIVVKLYAESFLFVFYVVMSVYGWMQWRKPDKGPDKPIVEWTRDRHIFIGIISVVTAVLIFSISVEFSDAAKPMMDALTTTFSICATFLVAKKVLSNWIYWIAIDAVSVYLYWSRGLDIYALLMVLYTGMAVYGFLQWKKEWEANGSPVSPNHVAHE